MVLRSAVIDKVCAIGAAVDGIKAAYGPNGTVQPLVKGIPKDLGNTVPALLMLQGEVPIIPGNWERQTWTLNGTIWVRDDVQRHERYRELIDLADPIIAAYRTAGGPSQAVDPDVQSVVLKSFSAIEGRQWGREQTAPWYLVMPFEVEIKVNRSTAYG